MDRSSTSENSRNKELSLQIDSLHTLRSEEKKILQKLAEEKAIIAEDPSHKEKEELWRNLNDRTPVRPMLWIDEIPWGQMNVNDELTLRCSHPIARSWEYELRKTLYSWKHLPDDRIITPSFLVPKIYSGGSFELDIQETVLSSSSSDEISSHAYHRQIFEKGDVDRLIRFHPAVYHREESEELLHAAKNIFGSSIETFLGGIRHIWFTPWDTLVQAWGIEQTLMDLILNPDLVEYALEKYVSNANKILDSIIEEGLLSDGAGNERVGSGGYGYTKELPNYEGLQEHVTPSDMWGCSNAQIFSEVSPEMHYDFAVKFDIPWMERWGMNYYGCCEPLHTKIPILKSIPKLRKISMSPWAKIDEAKKLVENDYVFSCKPNPSVFAFSEWNPEEAEKELTRTLNSLVSDGIPAEIIMKDISTVSNHPERLWEWAQIAKRKVENAYY